MARRGDRSLAALLLTQRLLATDAEPLKASEYWALLDAVPAVDELLDADVAAIAERGGVDTAMAARLRTLLDAATAFAFRLDQMEQAGLRVVSSVDEAYPATLERLGRSAPPLLYAYGDVELVSRPLLGIVGSRDVEPAAAEVAWSAARRAVAEGHGVVSGGAKAAVPAALEAGGVAVAVVADSLQAAVRDAELRRRIGEGRLCLCTPYKPDAGSSVAHAMGRNKLIYALSAATLVVASDHDQGGTWAGAVESLRQAIAPVLVWQGDGQGPGNDALVGRGAHAVRDVGELFPLA